MVAIVNVLNIIYYFSLYKRTLCCQVNEILLQNGNVSLADLSSTFSLPLNYVTPVSQLITG